jgi:hypothetical protein
MRATRAKGRWCAASGQALQAGIAALDGDVKAAETLYREALEGLREIGAVRDLALVLMDRSAVASDDAVASAAADEARSIWERLGARAALDRLDELVAARRAPAQPRTGDVAEPAGIPIGGR